MISDSQTYLAYRASSFAASAGTVTTREKLLKELSLLGSKLTDPTRRALFWQDAADRLGVSVDLLSKPIPNTKSDRVSESTNVVRSRIEHDFLAVLADNPSILDRVFESISPDDFDSRLHARIFAAFRAQYAASGGLDIGRLIADIDDQEAVSLLSEIAAEDVDPVQRRQEAEERLADFVDRKRRRVRTRLQDELAKAEAAGKHEIAEQLLEELKAYGL